MQRRKDSPHLHPTITIELFFSAFSTPRPRFGKLMILIKNEPVLPEIDFQKLRIGCSYVLTKYEPVSTPFRRCFVDIREPYSPKSRKNS